ncbi:hypothetical protein NLX83_39460 [Allokutzneria sp. A3M-2-11 16]|uniref:hypothetical protein n=1 Tax=Allokutzneria sp. A3M-2-11 16 TaxID=2962043 RepID=UPI0020B81411|nr:hypothetical protein [Allokutzneria sp. A3M-2-11 16]MCP3805362.1 hypothetical protein [Allokutzneria sp. A3M-2-11 16]
MTVHGDPPQKLARGVPGALSLVDSARAKVEAAVVELAEALRCVEDNPRTAPDALGEAIRSSGTQLRNAAARLGNAAARVKPGAAVMTVQEDDRS